MNRTLRGVATRKLEIVFQGDASKFKASAEEVDGRLSGLQKVAGAAILGAGAAAVAGGAVSLKAFADFDSKMREVYTLMPGISQAAMDDMTDQVKDFSREFGVLPNDVVPALYQSISAGVPPENVFSFLETAQKAAKGGVTELTTAVDGISSVVNAFGDDVLDATKASDLMFTAVKLGKTDFEQLSSSLFNVAPTAASMGIGFDEVTASLARMTAQGTPTSVATTQLRALFVETGKDGNKLTSAIQDITGKGMSQLISEGRTVQSVMNEVRGSMTDDEFRNLFGSVEALNAALATTGPQAESFDEAMAEMQNSAGATEAAFETMSGGLSDNWARMKANVAVLVIEVGEKLAPAFVKLSDWVVQKGLPAMAQLGDIFEQHIRPKIQSFVDFAIPHVQRFAEFAGEQFAKFMGYYENDLKPAFDNIVEGVQWVVEKVEEYWPQIEAIIKPVMDQVQLVVETAFKVITGVFNIFIQLLKGDFTSAWNAAKTLVGDVMDFFVKSVSNTWELIKGFIALFKELGWDIIRGMWDGFLDAWPAVIDWVKGLPGQIVTGMGNLGRLLWDKGKQVIQSLIDGMLSLKDKIPNPASWIPGADKVGGFLGSVGGKLGLGGGNDEYQDLSAQSSAVAQSQHWSQPQVNVTIQGPGLSALSHELDIYASGQLR